MTTQEQLEKWVNGESVHNDERDECCPDFSCCCDINTPKDVKERFAKAFNNGEHEVIHTMLMGFLGGLGGLAELEEKTVYVAGDKANHTPVQ